jgi:hypothetical protein
MRFIRSFLLASACGLTMPGVVSAQQTTTDTVAAPGGTTETLGQTTESLTSGIDSDAGTAGSTAAETFVGGNNAGDFVGGSRDSSNAAAANRFFRAITGEEVPTGGTAGDSGTPRRVPVTLRLGFAAPAPKAALVLAGQGGIDFSRFTRMRPELQAIGAVISDAGMVTLRGVVSDAATKRLAANLVRLQPGVRGVDNQIELQHVLRSVGD